MILAIGIMFEDAYTWSIGVSTTDPETVAKQLTNDICPDQILLVQNDLVIAHYNRGKQYDY